MALAAVRDSAAVNPDAYRALYAQALGSLAWSQLFTGNYAAAEQFARKGLSVDSTQTWIATNLAHALLFQNKYEKA